jgi:cytochrome c-type biogenesis protein
VYSLGLAVPFVAVGAGLTWATQASRWLRDRYRILQAVGGTILVAFGLLLFFGRDWWLNVALNRLLDFLGLAS